MKRLATIYTKVICVSAQKSADHKHCDDACKRAQHKYEHCYKSKAIMQGLPDGSELLLPNGTVIELSNGTMIISDREY